MTQKKSLTTFKSSFNKEYAKYYDLLYADKNYKKEAQYISNLIKQTSPRPHRSLTMMELGCGTGQYSRIFRDLKYKVTGIDQSKEMISLAEEKEQVIKSKKPIDPIHYKAISAQKLNFSNSFDVIVALFHVVSYQVSSDDIHSFIKSVSQHLKKNGIFIFDYWYGPGVLTDPPYNREKRITQPPITIHRRVKPKIYFDNNSVKLDYQIEIQDQIKKIIKEQHWMRYFFLPELENLAQQYGFKVKKNLRWLSNQSLKKQDCPWFSVSVWQKI